MSDNLVSIVITEDQQATVLEAVRQAHRSLPGLISLEPDERRALNHMGPRSEPFGRGTVGLLARNPQIVPPSLDVAGAQADIDAIDKLRPIAEAVAQLNAQLQDTLAALGHDVMDVALDGYAQLKIAGAAHGLEDLRRALGTRYARRRRNEAPMPA